MTQNIFITLLTLSLLVQTSCKKEEEAVVAPQFSISSVEVKSPSEVYVKFTISSLGNQGVKSNGMVWSTSPGPTVDNDKTTGNNNLWEGEEGGLYIKGLTAGINYYFRFFIIDNKDRITYSEDVVAATPLPEALSFSPAKGSSGTVITLTGNNLSDGSVVKFDGVKAEKVVGISTYQVKVPAGLTNNKVKITVELAGAVVSFPDNFSYLKGTWTQLKDLSWTDRRYSPGFSIQGYGYAGLEYYKKDFWRYNPATNEWNQMADFPGRSGIRCSHFVIDNKAYVISGPFRDVWCYDPSNNSWTSKKNFPGVVRDFAASFSINGFGYYGLGDNSGTQKDFWMYDPSIDQWFRMKDFPGPNRYSPTCVSLNGYGYMACGLAPDGDTTRYSDLWVYDPSNDSWKKKKDMPGPGRYGANSFVLNSKIYVGCGYYGDGKLNNDVWEYNPLTDEWIEVSNILVGRSVAFGFVINGKAYVGSGFETDNYYNTFWRLDL